MKITVISALFLVTNIDKHGLSAGISSLTRGSFFIYPYRSELSTLVCTVGAWRLLLKRVLLTRRSFSRLIAQLLRSLINKRARPAYTTIIHSSNTNRRTSSRRTVTTREKTGESDDTNPPINYAATSKFNS
jgi:hypothetical protein